MASVTALSADDRIELVGYIESTLDGGAVPTPEQHEFVARRDPELRAATATPVPAARACSGIRYTAPGGDDA